MARNKNYHKLARQTGFIKRPNVRQRIDQARARHESYNSQVADYDEYSVIVNPDGTHKEVLDKASEKKFGIFYKKGYRPQGLFRTREEAEKKLNSLARPDLYDIREIEWFEEDKEN